jgi:hypothetical protein
MRTVLGVAILALLTRVAVAAPPGATVPTPEQYTLSDDDRGVLADGEITSQQKIGAAIVDVMVGYGVGQAIEGRWRETGWQLAIGDAAFGSVFMLGLMAASLSHEEPCRGPGCAGPQIHTNAAMIIGLVGLGLVRTGGAIDAVVGANDHNRRVRELRARVSKAPYLSSSSGNGVVAGLDLRF